MNVAYHDIGACHVISCYAQIRINGTHLAEIEESDRKMELFFLIVRVDLRRFCSYWLLDVKGWQMMI